MKIKNKSIFGTLIAALAAPTLALAGDRDAFPRDAVIRKAKEAVEIAEDLTYEFETFLRERHYCAPNHRERELLTGLKELERRAGHVVKAAVTGCMPTTIERRSEYLRRVVEKTDILAVRVGVENLPCDIPGELELIDELACEISSLTRTRAGHRDHGGDRDLDRHARHDVDARDRHVVPAMREPVPRRTVREIPSSHFGIGYGRDRGRHGSVSFRSNLHFHNGSVCTDGKCHPTSSRGFDFWIYR